MTALEGPLHGMFGRVYPQFVRCFEALMARVTPQKHVEHRPATQGIRVNGLLITIYILLKKSVNIDLLIILAMRSMKCARLGRDVVAE